MPALLLLATLIAFLIFIVWERRRAESGSVTPLPREALKNGWRARPLRRWKVSAALGLLLGAMAAIQWVQPKTPPFTGRLSQVMTFFHAQFGIHGVSYFWAAFAAAMLLIAVFQFRSGSD
ncbi:MAG: hypothetical protein K2W93_13610 [Burkholderiaceae bacterium]|nr:hypothetical protein [Burkholderiaceae bacterium]